MQGIVLDVKFYIQPRQLVVCFQCVFQALEPMYVTDILQVQLCSERSLAEEDTAAGISGQLRIVLKETDFFVEYLTYTLQHPQINRISTDVCGSCYPFPAFVQKRQQVIHRHLV